MEKKIIDNIMKQDTSKSKKMIALYNEGMEIKDIAQVMGTRYNFVYNVVSNYCRMNDIAMRVVERENKKATIIQLIEAGKSNVEISAETKCCYNYVFGVRKAYEKEKAVAAK